MYIYIHTHTHINVRVGVEQQKCVWSVIISTSTSVYRGTTSTAAAAAAAASASHEPSARRTVQSCPPQTPSTMRPIPEELTTLIAGKIRVNSCVLLSVSVSFMPRCTKSSLLRERLVKKRKRRLNMDDSSFRLLSAAFPFMPSVKQYAGLTSKLLTAGVCVCVCVCVCARVHACVRACIIVLGKVRRSPAVKRLGHLPAK